jgi:hypothetical protein
MVGYRAPPGTQQPALGRQAGLGVAVDEALALGMDWTWARIRALAALLRASLAGAPGRGRGRVRAPTLPLGCRALRPAHRDRASPRGSGEQPCAA